MNSYQLIFKLIKVRADTYLTPADQALFHELVALCNEQRWKDVFFVRSNVLCGNLNMSDNTLRKSRKALADANLLFFETSKDKRIGCFYSFVQKLSNDGAAPELSPELSSELSSEPSSVLSSANTEDDKRDTLALSSAIFEDDTQITPIIYTIKTINKESHTHTREAPPPEKHCSSLEKTRPSFEKPQPFSESPEPSFEKIMPFSEKPDPSSEKLDSSYERPDPSSERLDSFSERPDPSYERPDPSSERPDPSSEKPDSSSERPDPSYEKPDPSYERLDPSYEKPDSFYKRPDPSYERPGPTYKKPRPSRKKAPDGPPLEYPFTSQRFLSVWKALRQTPKWKNKLNYALQLSLNKLGKFEEDFAIEQMERAAESNWTGVVFPGTEEKYKEWLKLKYGNNRNDNQPSKDGNGAPEPPAVGFKIIKF